MQKRRRNSRQSSFRLLGACGGVVPSLMASSHWIRKQWLTAAALPWLGCDTARQAEPGFLILSLPRSGNARRTTM